MKKNKLDFFGPAPTFSSPGNGLAYQQQQIHRSIRKWLLVELPTPLFDSSHSETLFEPDTLLHISRNRSVNKNIFMISKKWSSLILHSVDDS